MALPGTDYMIVAWGANLIATLLVFNRLYVKYTLRNDRDFKSDSVWRSIWKTSDYLVLVAWMFNITQTLLHTAIYADGGFSDEGMDSGDYAKNGFAQDVIYYVSPYCIKGAILYFYLEILEGVQILKGVRIATYIGMGLSVFGLIFTELTYLLQCRPISLNWDLDYEGYCWASPALTTAISWHMFVDVYIYIIPFFLLSEIKLTSTSKKISTFLMFTSGFILVLLAVPNLISTFSDILDGSYLWTYWIAILELNIGVVIACLPSARKMWNRCMKKAPALSMRRPSHWAAAPLMKQRPSQGGVGLNGTTIDAEQGDITVIGADSVDWGRNMSVTVTGAPEPWERGDGMSGGGKKERKAKATTEQITFAPVKYNP